jgi:hypothetical protein
MATLIDTLEYSKKLRAAGVPELQAEAHAEALSKLVSEELATKKDIDDLRRDLQTTIRELEYRLTIKVGAMTAAAVAALAVIIKLH